MKHIVAATQWACVRLNLSEAQAGAVVRLVTSGIHVLAAFAVTANTGLPDWLVVPLAGLTQGAGKYQRTRKG